MVDVTEEKVIAIEDLPVHHQFSVKNRNAGVTVPQASANYDQALLANTSSSRPSSFESRPRPSSAESRHRPTSAESRHRPSPVESRPRPVEEPSRVKSNPHHRTTPQGRYRVTRQERQRGAATGLRVSGNLIEWQNFRIRIGLAFRFIINHMIGII